MQQLEPLLSGNFYHIYNRGINSAKLFNETSNYEHFLDVYVKYISPVANTFAWVLMPNHFHFLVQIKENIVYKYSNTDRSTDAVRFFEEHKWETIDLADLSACKVPDSVEATENTVINSIKIPKPHLHFSHLFNAYSSYFNKRYGRHGSLFERPFHRKLIDNETYLKHVIIYIHNNPVHHGFCEHPVEYTWSSYLGSISAKLSPLKLDDAMTWFDNEDNYKQTHDSEINIKWIEDVLKI